MSSSAVRNRLSRAVWGPTSTDIGAAGVGKEALDIDREINAARDKVPLGMKADKTYQSALELRQQITAMGEALKAEAVQLGVKKLKKSLTSKVDVELNKPIVIAPDEEKEDKALAAEFKKLTDVAAEINALLDKVTNKDCPRQQAEEALDNYRKKQTNLLRYYGTKVLTLALKIGGTIGGWFLVKELVEIVNKAAPATEPVGLVAKAATAVPLAAQAVGAYVGYKVGATAGKYTKSHAQLFAEKAMIFKQDITPASEATRLDTAYDYLSGFMRRITG
jgi:hypothetical protein